MIAEIADVQAELKRLSNKPKWPFDVEAQLELARVATKHASGLTHLREIIAEISERWDHCPDGKELREVLTRDDAPPAFQGRTNCPLDSCDGSGWVEVFALHTRSRKGNAAFVDKQFISREQAIDLEKKIDQETQTIYSGVRRCACRPATAVK